MKKSLAIAGITLLALAPIARIALCDDNASKTAASTTATVTKGGWPVSTAPIHHAKAGGVPNFGKLNDDVWRSGQPTRDGYKALAAQGLKTVVNLREEFPQDKELLPPGIKYVYIPVKDEHAPTDEQARLFIETVSNPANWPVLVHCKGGEGRAGTMAALVRHSFDGWDNDRIMKEVGNFRVKHLGFITTAMPSCQRDFIKHWEETPAVAVQDAAKAAAVPAAAQSTETPARP